MGPDIAAEGEYAGEIYLEYGVPVAIWELVCWVSLLDPAAVQKDVDSVAVGEDFWGKFCYARIGGEIGGVDCCFAAESFDGLFGLLVGFVALGDVRGDLVGLMGSGVPGRGGCPLLLLREQWPLIDQFLVCRL
jgi:hypothetical protein